jgi:hypothetical protein
MRSAAGLLAGFRAYRHEGEMTAVVAIGVTGVPGRLTNSEETVRLDRANTEGVGAGPGASNVAGNWPRTLLK